MHHLRAKKANALRRIKEMKKYLANSNAGSNLVVCILILAAVNLACMGIRKPWRDYTAKPFSSAEWLAGDRIERGRMTIDLFKKRTVGVSTREEAVKTLGEPDFKKTIENKEVWFYRIELGQGIEAMDLIPVSFDDKGRGAMGMSSKGTASILAREDQL